MTTYNLVLVHAPQHLDISDFLRIQRLIAEQATDIEVSIVSPADGPRPKDFWLRMNSRPSLVFSPLALKIPEGLRGIRLVSKAINKMEELQVLRLAGAPVPETRLITPELQLDEASWGPFTVVKPLVGLLGRGVSLMRTKNVRWVDTTKLPKDNPRYKQWLVAQRFIDAGRYTAIYRVMTVLGRPIYCILSTALDERREGDEVPISENGVERSVLMSNEADVIELATSVHSKLPHLPMMAIDVIREEHSGKLYALEFNSVGYSWHLSSDFGQRLQAQYKLDFYSQFDALNTIAGALVEATRKYAF